MISVKNLTKAYGEKVIFSYLSFEIDENICTAFMGASGIGKTTLLRCISGLEKTDGGKITGLENKRLSFVFQENRLIENISVKDNILCIANDIKKCEELIKKAGLEEAADKKARDLSGGMKRRLSIIRSLCYGGDIFIFDEPLRELDGENTQNMLELIRAETYGKTVLLITHDNEQADFLAEREIVFAGQPMQMVK